MGSKGKWARVWLAALMLPATVRAEITVFGNGGLSIDVVNDGNKYSLGVSSNQSYFGIKGGHPIRENLEGVFEVSMRYDLTGETATLAPGNRYIGFEGEYGRFVAGYHYTSHRFFGRQFDIFKDTIADATTIIGSNIEGTNKYNRRASNAIVYTPPALGKFQLHALYSTSLEGASTDSGSDNNETSMTSIGIDIELPSLALYGAYETHDEDNSNSVRLVAVRKRQQTRIGILAETIRAGNNSILTHNSFGINGAYTLSATTFKAQFIISGAAKGIDNSKAATFAIGVYQKLDKYIALYVIANALINESNAAYSLGNIGHDGDRIVPSAPGKNLGALSVGCEYTFN